MLTKILLVNYINCDLLLINYRVAFHYVHLNNHQVKNMEVNAVRTARSGKIIKPSTKKGKIFLDNVRAFLCYGLELINRAK